jgi:hypothetical protein
MGLLAWIALAPLVAAQTGDQVLWRNARGQTNDVVGVVTEDSLTNVVISAGTSTRKLESLSVESIVFGDVPATFRDAETYFERGDFENAAAKFSLAAGDATARAVVRARARLSAAESWLKRASADKNAIPSSRRECELFLAEYPTQRDVPRARLLLGRLQRLAGEAKASETYAALYREASGATATLGYPPLVSFRAGLAAGEALLAQKDVAKAREICAGLDGALGAALANLAEGSPLRVEYLRIQSEARLGEGFCLLAAGSLSQAKTFFQGQIANAAGNAAKRFGAGLGLGEALLSEGNARAAELELALVSAIDPTSDDRTARALVGLAQCALKLEARADARLWLEAVISQHGDTPSAPKARDLLASL